MLLFNSSSILVGQTHAFKGFPVVSILRFFDHLVLHYLTCSFLIKSLGYLSKGDLAAIFSRLSNHVNAPLSTRQICHK